MSRLSALPATPLPAIRRTDPSGAFRPFGTRGFIGTQIRTARRLSGMARDRLAINLGLDSDTLVAFEHGIADVPALTMVRLAEALGKPLPWFFHATSGVSTEAPDAGSAARRRAEDRRLRVLLVDDASDVLLVLGAFLEGAGLQVIKASGGDEALGIITGSAPLHVLVTDSVMPGMSGVDLLMQAHQVRPSLPGLLITGYAEAVARAGDLPAGVAVLRKPFRREELVARVHSLARSATAVEQPVAVTRPVVGPHIAAQ